MFLNRGLYCIYCAKDKWLPQTVQWHDLHIEASSMTCVRVLCMSYQYGEQVIWKCIQELLQTGPEYVTDKNNTSFPVRRRHNSFFPLQFKSVHFLNFMVFTKKRFLFASVYLLLYKICCKIASKTAVVAPDFENIGARGCQVPEIGKS